MTNHEIFSYIADELRGIISSGAYGVWETLHVEYAIEDPHHPGYIIIVLDAELALAQKASCTECGKCYSVSIHRTDANGHADEKLITTYSESDDLLDLENAVYAALRRLEHECFHDTLVSKEEQLCR